MNNPIDHTESPTVTNVKTPFFLDGGTHPKSYLHGLEIWEGFPLAAARRAITPALKTKAVKALAKLDQALADIAQHDPAPLRQKASECFRSNNQHECRAGELLSRQAGQCDLAILAAGYDTERVAREELASIMTELLAATADTILEDFTAEAAHAEARLERFGEPLAVDRMSEGNAFRDWSLYHDQIICRLFSAAWHARFHFPQEVANPKFVEPWQFVEWLRETVA